MTKPKRTKVTRRHMVEYLCSCCGLPDDDPKAGSEHYPWSCDSVKRTDSIYRQAHNRASELQTKSEAMALSWPGVE